MLLISLRCIVILFIIFRVPRFIYLKSLLWRVYVYVDFVSVQYIGRVQPVELFFNLWLALYPLEGFSWKFKFRSFTFFPGRRKASHFMANIFFSLRKSCPLRTHYKNSEQTGQKWWKIIWREADSFCMSGNSDKSNTSQVLLRSDDTLSLKDNLQIRTQNI
jgi:hypothetical protein